MAKITEVKDAVKEPGPAAEPAPRVLPGDRASSAELMLAQHELVAKLTAALAEERAWLDRLLGNHNRLPPE